MNKREFQRNLHKAGLLSVLLLYLFLCFGCGREEKNTTVTPTGSGALTTTVTPDVSPGPTAEVTVTPTASPTPMEDISKVGYETYLRKDIYRIPVGETKEGWTVKDARFAGEYALLWYVTGDESTVDAKDDALVLICPAVNKEQYRCVPDFTIRAFDVLADGTVLLEESGTGIVHVFDNTLTELRTIPSREKAMVAGFGEDGTIWSVNIRQRKIYATDMQGELQGEYSYDNDMVINEYVGCYGNRVCFRTSTGAESNSVGILYISIPSGEIVMRDDIDWDLGYAWTHDEMDRYGEWDCQDSKYLFFFHAPGYGTEGVVFPKSAPIEKPELFEGERMCASFCQWDGDTVTARTYRLYNLESREVSGPLPDEEFGEFDFFEPKGIVGDGVLFNIRYKDGSEDLLLWAPGADREPILGFCDLTKDDPTAVLDTVIAVLKEQYNIVITPDRAVEGESLPIGDVLAQMETAATFLVAARTNPDVVKSASGAIHPENSRNNDGGHYTFKPHVISPFLEKEREGAKETFFAFIDALRAGEDSFACPDEETMKWCGNELAHYCFLIAEDYAYGEYIGDGRAKIIYRVGKEVYLKREREYEAQIEAILNDVLEDDYTDLEKALALYEFIAEYCVYDWNKWFGLMNFERGVTQTGYRVLVEQKGVCWEIASLYAYLLMQSGVGADVVIGESTEADETERHAWVYLELDGQGYLIDPTWGITDARGSELAYFLFTDEMREMRDLWRTASAEVAGAGPYKSREKYSFFATDDRYSPLWNGWFIAFDEEADCIYYADRYSVMHKFEYGK